MTKPRESDHEWFRRRLPDHLLDLLEGGDRTRFDSHARRCAPCARLLASALGARGDWWDGAGHLPVGVLLGWDESARDDLGHDAVRSHLQACDECRADLAELRGADVAARIHAVPVPIEFARPRRAAGSAWRPMAAAMAGVGALAAAIALWPRDPHPGSAVPAPVIPTETRFAAPSEPAEPAPAPQHAPARETPSGPLVAAAVHLESPARGASAGPTRVELEPGIASVPFTLPPLAAPDDAPLEIELRDVAGVLVHRQVLSAERALRAGGVVLPASELAAGAYVLRVVWSDPELGETVREFPIAVSWSR